MEDPDSNIASYIEYKNQRCRSCWNLSIVSEIVLLFQSFSPCSSPLTLLFSNPSHSERKLHKLLLHDCHWSWRATKTTNLFRHNNTNDKIIHFGSYYDWLSIILIILKVQTCAAILTRVEFCVSVRMWLFVFFKMLKKLVLYKYSSRAESLKE